MIHGVTISRGEQEPDDEREQEHAAQDERDRERVVRRATPRTRGRKLASPRPATQSPRPTSRALAAISASSGSFLPDADVAARPSRPR